jgi:hypothetical protein
MARRPTAAQLREKRARTLVIAFSVVFVIVMVIQGPKLLKSLSGGNAAPSGGTVAGALPAGVNPSAPTAAVAATGSSTAAIVSDSQLTNLSRFAFKDPFHALVNVPVTSAAAGAAAATAGTAGTAGTTGTAGTAGTAGAAGSAGSSKPATLSPAAAAAAAVGPTVTFTATKTPPNAAVVKTNGRRQILFVGDDFPKKGPLFKLVALGKKNIRIGVLGGSFTSGVATIKLRKGKRLTLANQADGSRYVLQLLRLTTATPPPTTAGSSSTPSTTTPATTTPATTTPATTTTTPATTTPATTTPAG